MTSLVRASLAAALVALPLHATAGGFYLMERGVRPLGRGGAFVAGADDGHAVWYNPAGLSEARNGLLLDATLMLFSNSYARTARPDNGMAPVSLGTADGSGAPLPIPTLVLTHDFGLRDFRFAAGVYAPYAALPTYPDAATAPQRYQLITLEGSLFAVAGVWASWKPHRAVSVGLGVELLAGSFVSRLAFSGCPATVTCAPEDPDWDSVAQLSVSPILAPTANVGVRVNPHRTVSIGASFHLPAWVDADASLKVRLPSSPFYDGARIEGDAARVAFRFAPIARLGVEVRPAERTRVELAASWEGWSVHDQISLTPRNIRITNVRAVGTYDVGPIALPRNFQDVWSVRLGAEQGFALGEHVLTARAGFAWETSATTPESTSVLTFDAAKATLSLGASFATGRWRLDAVFAHTFWGPVETTPCAYDPRAPQRCQGLYPTAPFRTGANAPRYTINGGTYSPSLNAVGLGVQYGF